jgi:hypothetical protein
MGFSSKEITFQFSSISAIQNLLGSCTCFTKTVAHHLKFAISSLISFAFSNRLSNSNNTHSSFHT